VLTRPTAGARSARERLRDEQPFTRVRTLRHQVSVVHVPALNDDQAEVAR
jgi:phage head maturation protease